MRKRRPESPPVSVARRGARRRLRSCGILATRGSALPGSPTFTCPERSSDGLSPGRSSDSLDPGRSSESRSPGRTSEISPAHQGWEGRSSQLSRESRKDDRNSGGRRIVAPTSAPSSLSPPSFRDGAVAPHPPAPGTKSCDSRGYARLRLRNTPARRVLKTLKATPSDIGWRLWLADFLLPKLVLRPAGVRGAGCVAGASGSGVRE